MSLPQMITSPLTIVRRNGKTSGGHTPAIMRTSGICPTVSCSSPLMAKLLEMLERDAHALPTIQVFVQSLLAEHDDGA